MVGSIRNIARRVDPEWNIHCDKYIKDKDNREISRAKSSVILHLGNMRQKKIEQMFKVLNLVIRYVENNKNDATSSETRVSRENVAASVLRQIAQKLL